MNESLNNRQLWLTTTCLLLTIGVLWLARQTAPVARFVILLHTAVRPGRLVVTAISPGEPSAKTAESDELSTLQNELLTNELQRRRLLIDNARLHNRLRIMQRDVAVEAATGNLVQFMAMKANVLSHTGLPQRLKSAFIDAGSSEGLRRSQLVIDRAGLIIDRGTVDGLQTGHRICQGAAVIGRVAEVSQWVSHVQPVTDEDFSAAVQLVRLNPAGAAYGERGLLEGTGTAVCRLTGIPYTASVAVGDEVFSASLEGIAGPRLYFGRVIQASFSPGGEWQIDVEPAFTPDDLTEVAVIRQQLQLDSSDRNGSQ